MTIYRARTVLNQGLHPQRYGFIPRWQITHNISNALIGIENAKHNSQDVLIMQVDFIAQVMVRLGIRSENGQSYLLALLQSRCTMPARWLTHKDMGIGHWLDQ